MKDAVLAACGIVAVAVIGWCFGAGHMSALCRDILITDWMIVVLVLQA